MTSEGRIEDVLRGQAPRVLGTLVRRYGHFDACEDAVQEALIAAALQWPGAGVPESPAGWLITVATRRLTDAVRSDAARRRREEGRVADPTDAPPRPAQPGEPAPADEDDTLTLLFLCCHPDLSPASRIALTLRVVGGLTTAEIAAAFLVPEATMAQRISRAKSRLQTAGVTLDMPPEPERSDRLAAALHVLYLIFNEGYTATSGPHLQRAELAREAIRLAGVVHALLPDDGEVSGLLALMLLIDARRSARAAADGSLIPLAEQDRRLWDKAGIRAGSALVTESLRSAPLGPYQLQAAIAAVHAEAPRASDTDWAQIVALYELLERSWPNPMVTLNHAVAVAMLRGPEAGLELLEPLAADDRIADHHRLDAVRGHLLEQAGDREGARSQYLRAARRTTSLPERAYLEGRAARLTGA